MNTIKESSSAGVWLTVNAVVDEFAVVNRSVINGLIPAIELKVIVSDPAAVVIVIPSPATRVKVSSVASATTLV